MALRLMCPLAKPNYDVRVPVESSTEPHPSVRLRRFCTAVHAGLTPDPNDMHWVAARFDRVLDGEAADTALDLKPKPGQRSWGTRTALDQRDRLLREAARRFYAGLPVAAQAQHLHVQLTRYSATAWVRERACEACPDCRRGMIDELLWRALRHHDRVLSARSIRDILARR